MYSSILWSSKNTNSISNESLFSGYTQFSQNSESLKAKIINILESIDRTMVLLLKNWKKTIVGSIAIGLALFTFYKYSKQSLLKYKTRIENLKREVMLKYNDNNIVGKLYGLNLLRRNYPNVFNKIANLVEKRKSDDEIRNYISTNTSLPNDVKDRLLLSDIEFSKDLEGLERFAKEDKSYRKIDFYKSLIFTIKILIFLCVAEVIFVLLYPLVKKTLFKQITNQENINYTNYWVLDRILLSESTNVLENKSKVGILSFIFNVLESLRKKSVNLLEKIKSMPFTYVFFCGVGLGMICVLISVIRRGYEKGGMREFITNEFWPMVREKAFDKGKLILGVVSTVFLFTVFLGSKG